MSTIKQNKKIRKIDFKELGLDILDITLDIFTFWLPKILMIVLLLIVVGSWLYALPIISSLALHGSNPYWYSPVNGIW